MVAYIEPRHTYALVLHKLRDDWLTCLEFPAWTNAVKKAFSPTIKIFFLSIYDIVKQHILYLIVTYYIYFIYCTFSEMAIHHLFKNHIISKQQSYS